MALTEKYGIQKSNSQNSELANLQSCKSQNSKVVAELSYWPRVTVLRFTSRTNLLSDVKYCCPNIVAAVAFRSLHVTNLLLVRHSLRNMQALRLCTSSIKIDSRTPGIRSR